MAAAIQGAVITMKNGLHVQYRKKCESCGYVQPQHNPITVPSSAYSKYSGSFKCRCGYNQKIEIAGGL